jgi:tetratricopeptide (TPR) repeat protein
MKLIPLLLLACPYILPAQDIEQLLTEAKQLESSSQEELAVKNYEEILKRDPNHLLATWNASLLYSKIGQRQVEASARKPYFHLARDYAARALKINPQSGDANYVMAVAMGYMALVSPPKEKVAAVREIKRYAELCVQYQPNHAGAYHLLGKWHYEVSNLNFAEKAAAKYLFGGIPAATLDESAKYYVQAIKLDPQYILFYLDLALTLEDAEYYNEARKTCEKALTFPAKEQDDPVYLAELKKILARLP